LRGFANTCKAKEKKAKTLLIQQTIEKENKTKSTQKHNIQ
jgi:hypothetical protein